MTFTEFNQKLRSADTEDKRAIFVENHVLNGTPYLFKEDQQSYFEFRNIISNFFGCDYQSVTIVGSAQLGFNLKGKDFDLDSDIDVAITNETVFNQYSDYLCQFQYLLDDNHSILSTEELKTYHRFLKYHVKGWIRPDFLPPRLQILTLKQDWIDFFHSISYDGSVAGNYKVQGRIYKSREYLRRYHIRSIQKYYNTLA